MTLSDQLKDLLNNPAMSEKVVIPAGQVEFYEQMKRLGIAKKQPYNIPMLDTTGRDLAAPVSLRVR